jgi:hypothetical protein
MSGPGDNAAAAEDRGDGRLRASRADREQVVELLKAAFVEDRLTKEELGARVEQALTSRTYADLAAVTADIPAGLIAGQPRAPVRIQGRPPMSNAAKAGISVAVAAAVPAVLSLAIGPLAFVMFAPFYLMALLVAGAQILFNRYDKRSCGQLPPGPGQAAEGQQPGLAGHDPALPGARPDQTRAELRTFRARPDGSHSCGRGALAPRGMRPVPDTG